MPKATGRPTTKPFCAPELPPFSAQELQQSADLRKEMQELRGLLRQRNLDNAVALAQQAAREQGPLIEHFRELGGRYGHLLKVSPKAGWRVIDGGVGD